MSSEFFHDLSRYEQVLIVIKGLASVHGAGAVLRFNDFMTYFRDTYGPSRFDQNFPSGSGRLQALRASVSTYLGKMSCGTYREIERSLDPNDKRTKLLTDTVAPALGALRRPPHATRNYYQVNADTISIVERALDKFRRERAERQRDQQQQEESVSGVDFTRGMHTVGLKIHDRMTASILRVLLETSQALTAREIAQRIGANEDVVGKRLSAMKQIGIVRREGRQWSSHC